MMNINDMTLEEKMTLLNKFEEKENYWKPISVTREGKYYTDTWNTDISFEKYFSEREEMDKIILEKFKSIYRDIRTFELLDSTLTVTVAENGTCKAAITIKRR